MRHTITSRRGKLMALAACILTGASSPSLAQTRPEYQVIFDDFDYASESELFGWNSWTDLDGKPLSRDRAWFRASWEANEYAPTAHVYIDRPGEVRLQADGGHFFTWKSGWMPPVLSSGFVHRTGTWAARIRFDDIAMGRKTDTPLTHAFWTFSPNIACVTDPTDRNCPRSDKRWSEFNHEWNNYFDPPREQFLANGGIVDGEDDDAGEFRMRDPATPNSTDLSCRRYDDVIEKSISDSDECMEWFVSDQDRSRYVDLIIQYDNENLVFEAIARNENPSKQAGHAIEMREVVKLGRRVQPMVTKFSVIGKTRDKCLDRQIMDLSCWKQDRALGFSAEWFFYTPDTNLSAQDIDANVKWLRENRRIRVNTTGRSLDRPRRQGRLSIVLESPITNSRRDWIVVPSQRSTLYYRLKIGWSYRTKRTPDETWSGWSEALTDGFTFNPGLKYEDYYNVNVSVSVTDWYDAGNTRTLSACLSDYGRSTVPCTEKIDRYRLGDNHPDPFNPSTTISFEIPFDAPVRVSVYNALGQEVARPVDDFRKEGSYSVRWDASAFGSGVYFYELTSGVFRDLKTMVLLR